MKKRSEAGGNATKFFGMRKSVGTNYMDRAMGVYMGIFGNVPQVSIYLSMPTDANGADRRQQGRLHAALRKRSDPAGEVLLVDHDVFLAGSLPRREPDQAVFHWQPHARHENQCGWLADPLRLRKSPGPDKEGNWLPAPSGPFWTVMRCYGAGRIIDGMYKQPDYVREAAEITIRGDGDEDARRVWLS